LVVVLFLPWPLGHVQFFDACGFFPIPLLLCMYARRRVGGETVGGFVGGGGVFCLAFSAWLALHNITQYGASAWDWGGFVLNGHLPLATSKKQGQRERKSAIFFSKGGIRSRDLENSFSLIRNHVAGF
jgi:hypothetical protein